MNTEGTNKRNGERMKNKNKTGISRRLECGKTKLKVT